MEERESPAGFKFKLGQTVTIQMGGLRGLVVARCEYDNAEPSYQLRYVTPDGAPTQKFWTESALF